MPINIAVNAPKNSSPENGSGDKKLDREKLKRACTDFEALFMAEIMKSMRQTVPQTGFLGKGLGDDVYHGLMDQELSKKLSQSKGLGLGKMMYRQMLKREEKISTVSPGRQPLTPLSQSHSRVGGNR